MKFVCLLLSPCPNEEEGLCITENPISCDFAMEVTECASRVVHQMIEKDKERLNHEDD